MAKEEENGCVDKPFNNCDDELIKFDLCIWW